jgi:phospholipid/cholesterol/gamma-HCH transport system substrate-binding protein
MNALKDFATEARKAVGEVAQPASAAARSFDAVAQELMTSAGRLSAVLTTIHQAASKMESGEGTAARLLNDPKLYNNLVDATHQMASLVKELREFVNTWKDRGVPIKLK